MGWKQPKERAVVVIAFVIIAACVGLKLELPADATNLTSSPVHNEQEVLSASVPEFIPGNISPITPEPAASSSSVPDPGDLRFVNFTLQFREDLCAHQGRMGNYTSMNMFPEMEVEVDNFYRYLERSLDELSYIQVTPKYAPLKEEEEQALKDAKRYEFFMLTAIRAAENKQFNEYYEQLGRANQYSQESSGHLACLAGMYQNVSGSPL